ncbi:MAG: hypothetical protein EZS28_016755, partial [Streblomastix strix]
MSFTDSPKNQLPNSIRNQPRVEGPGSNK